MNQNKSFWPSISILIGVVIAILALLRGPLAVALLAASFAVWGIWVVVTIHKQHPNRPRRIRPRSTMPEPEDAPETPHIKFEVPEVEAGPLEKLLLLHVNQRITESLRAVYPNAKWSWCERDPELLASQGGMGRIKIFGAADYDRADITLDQNGNLRCDLIRVVPLPKGIPQDIPASFPDPCEPEPETTIDPQAWYEMQGRKVLESVIADLNSRGHNTLILHEDGSIHISEGEQDVSQTEHLTDFPPRKSWPGLLQVFERNGVAAQSSDTGILLTW